MSSVATAPGATSAIHPSTRARVNTKTARRRLVSYAALSDLVNDLDKIEAAHRAGTLKRLGNHDAGPILFHVALAMRGSFDGFPALAPAWLRWIGPLLKNRVLSRPFEPGFNLAKDAEGKAWNDAITFEEGVAQLRQQIARAAAPGAAPSAAHPFFGPLKTPQWQTYYLRHAELHLSFLQL